MITINEMLKTVKFEEIATKITLHYGTKEIEQYHKLYIFLTNQKVHTNSNEPFYIYITAYHENSAGESVMLERFDEDDVQLDFDVSAYISTDDVIYSISTIDKIEFLTCKVDEKTLANYTYATILAHCFWEITCYSFT